MNECKFKGCDGECEGKIELRDSMTSYHWDKESGKPDPNAPFYACKSHNEMYVEYWSAMWDEYYRGLL